MKIRNVIILALIIAVSLTGCIIPSDPVLRYSGENLALDAAAIYSMPGVESSDSDEILILEQDTYGRTLYAICLNNDIILLDANRAYDWKVLAIVIIQGQDESSVYFGGEKNYRMTKIEGTTKLSKETVANAFNETVISQLKEENDWDISPLQTDKTPVKAPIRVEKEISLTRKQTVALEKYIGSNLRSMFLRQDVSGRQLFFVVRIRNQTPVAYMWYAVLVNADGSIDGQDGICRLTNLQTIHEDINAFLAIHNWKDMS